MFWHNNARKCGEKAKALMASAGCLTRGVCLPSLKRTGCKTELLTKDSCHVRLAGESATSRYVDQRYVLGLLEHAPGSLNPTFREILMRGLTGCGTKHPQEMPTAVVRVTRKIVEG